MTGRRLKRLAYKPALKPEDLDESLRQLRRDMAEAAEQLAVETAVVDENDQPRDPLEVPDLADRAVSALRALLEEETFALIEPEGPRGIRAHELTHEWQKKALAGLKRDTLASIAKARGLLPSAKLDDLVAQVAASYGWDEQAIARLILDYAEDPQVTEGGLTSRVFVLKQPTDLEWAVDRLAYVDGRYYRTDIAKWFTFERFSREGSTLRIDGQLRTYTVGASADEAHQENDRLLPEPSEFNAQLVIREGSPIAVVHKASTASVARSSMSAFKVATRSETLSYVPNTGVGAVTQSRTLHPATEWLLDLVNYRFRSHLFRNKNAVLARFRFTPGSESSSSDSATKSRKASLRAVRFEGDNLMVSPAACGLMWTEGRPLVDLTMMVTATVSDSDSTIRGTLPVRVALEKDHVLVATGLVSDVPLMNAVHHAALNQVELAITNAVDAKRRANLERVVREQAENPNPDAEDVLLGDPADIADPRAK